MRVHQAGDAAAASGLLCATGVPATPQLGLPMYDKAASGALGKTRIVILGSGWGAMSFVKRFEESATERYELILVSPRNYFVYTPLLPAMCAGTVEERSIVEAVRAVLGSKGKFFEATVKEILPEERTIVACFPEDAGFAEACFKIPYDKLVVAVGCVNNTFGIAGVEQHTNFFKTVEDASRLRLRVSECFERAALPQTTQEERRQLLSFVICGGGPTGVEVAAELHDLIKEDLVKLYPDEEDLVKLYPNEVRTESASSTECAPLFAKYGLFIGDLVKLYPSEVKDVRISLVEMTDHVLSMYDREISRYTAELFKRNGIELVLSSRVTGVSDSSVSILGKEGAATELPFGACVWATGVAMNPLIKSLQAKLPEGSQTHFRSIVTDEYLRVKGSGGSIYALGDAATIEQDKQDKVGAAMWALVVIRRDELPVAAIIEQGKALDKAEQLFEQADVNGDGKLCLRELHAILKTASEDFPHLSEHARFLDGKLSSALRFDGLVWKALEAARVRDTGANKCELVFKDMVPDAMLDREQFRELLKKIDSGLLALPPTAQVARQEGEYLAQLFQGHYVAPEGDLPPNAKPFQYNHKGSAAYVGADHAVLDIPVLGLFLGPAAGLIWKGFETFSQISFRNQVLVATDWARAKIFGRDTSRV
ncbi:hypothetical protein N2152v2_002690 [Parachlorella kessleri]